MRTGVRGRPRGAAAPATLGVAAVVCGLVLASCAAGSTALVPGSHGSVSVVAAENFWGSIARQVGGTRAEVTSIVTNPNTDPHSYEPTARDARAVAGAQFVIENGIGYDPWMAHLLAGNPSAGRVVIDVGRVVGIPVGGNPHRWYDPADVARVIGQISTGFGRIDPKDAGYFHRQAQDYETQGLARYHQLIRQIRDQFAGTPIGASESIVTPLADALGLKMRTPESFLDAISEGTEPSAADKAEIDAQIAQHQIRIYIYNRQNSTPDVAAQVAEANAHGIPVTTVTETLVPADSTFQAWQVTQLQGIEAALVRARGR